jgi:hypothetical protein
MASHVVGILRHPLALLQRGKFRSVPEQCPATVPLPLQALHARHSSSQTPHFHGRTADWFGKQGQSFSPRDAFAAKGNPGWLSARSAAEHRRRSSTGRQGESAVVGMSPPRELRGRPGPKYARESSIRSAHSTKGGSRAGGALAEGASGEGEARARTQRGLRLSTECVRFVRDNDNGTYTVCLRSLLHTCAPEDSDARQETLIMGRWLDRWHTRPKWEVTTTSLSSTMAIPPLLYIAAAAPRLHVGALTLQRAVGPRHRYPIVALHHLL